MSDTDSKPNPQPGLRPVRKGPGAGRDESLAQRLGRLRRQPVPASPEQPGAAQEPAQESAQKLALHPARSTGKAWRADSDEVGSARANRKNQGTGPQGARGLPIWVQRRLAKAAAPDPAHHPRHRDPKDRVDGKSSPAQRTRATSLGLPQRLQSAGDSWFRNTLLPVDHRHGQWNLQRAMDTPRETWVALTGDPALEHLDPSTAVYLDTETTGLSGGAGVFVYMVGLARFVPGEGSQADQIEVWQGFLRGPEEEGAMLQEVARRIEASSGVVSFFGKSFDRHRLEDKMRIHGVASPFEHRPHLDLYHPLRRLHRHSYANHRLQTMERALCGFARLDDLPGSQAPEAWFDYLAERPHRLEGVFQHNLDDVLSLIGLADWLGRVEQRSVREGSPVEWEREGALAEAWTRVGQVQRAHTRLHGLSEREDAPTSLWLQRAQLEYRLQRFEDCLQTLRNGFEGTLAEPGGPDTVERVQALALLSKTLEHKVRDREGAWKAAFRAQQMLGRLRPFRGRGPLETEINKRHARLAGKLSSEPPSPG